jgi:hypothetical protein
MRIKICRIKSLHNFYLYNFGRVDEIQEEMGGACSIYGRNEKFLHSFNSEQ